MVDTTGFVVSLVLNAAIAIIATILFLTWRPKYPWCYDTRREPQRRVTGCEPPTVPDGGFNWLVKTLRYTDAEVMDTAGLDGLMFIKFFEMCSQLFIALCVFGIGILLPVNFTAHGDVADSFDQMSMANTPQQSERLWAHLFIAYIFSACFYYLAYHVWQDYLNLRHQFLNKWSSIGGGHTILIHNLPAEIRTDTALLAYFQKLYPGQIRGARMAKDLKMKKDEVNKLESLGENVVARANVEAELENNIATWEKTLADEKIPAEKKQRPQVATKMLCCGKVDAIDHNQAELERLNGIIEKKRAEFKPVKGANANDAVPTLLSAFVTFHSAKAAYAASYYVYDTQPYSFEAKLAPELRDVYWPSLNFTHAQRTSKTLIFNILTGLLCLFWMIPMGILQGVSNLTQLAEEYSWLSGIYSIPSVIRGFIEAYLPALMLIVFFIVVPMILLAWTKAQGVEAHSWQQKGLMDKYFIFIVINFFFGAIVGTSLLGKISELFSDPGQVPAILGQTIPKTANYFVNYVALASLAGFPLQMSQVGRLLVGGIMKKYVALTPREFEQAEAPPELLYGMHYPKHLFIFIIAITYSFISPIIIPFSAVYFILGWIVFKYQIVHVFVQKYESGGSFWPSVFTKMVISLLIGQLCLVGLLGIKEVPAQAALVVPLPILTLLFYRYIETAIKTKLRGLPLDQMVEIDAARKSARVAKDVAAGKNSPEGEQAPLLAGSADSRTTAVGASVDNSSLAPSTAVAPNKDEALVVIHAEPQEEKINNGDLHKTETYLVDKLDVDASTNTQAAHALIGFPYARDEQNRASMEGDLNEYIQPELLSLVIPDRIVVNRAEKYLTANGGAQITVKTSDEKLANVEKAEQVEMV